ncbi:hypothetical protein ACHAAC_16620 [Aeromicrobium sp. CF4.19]|uniref:hypothetical protein n=1 Tax=Aeromicrobium sp. CF4.19 TaxID=3373082 RepID=UPI003EE67CD4
MSGTHVGANVDGLHKTGGKIAGRSSGGSTAGKNLGSNLDSSATAIGHGRIKSALTAFVTNGVIDKGNLLGTQVTAAGNNVANVAATVRNEDNEGARTVHTSAAQDTSIADRINGSTAV